MPAKNALLKRPNPSSIDRAMKCARAPPRPRRAGPSHKASCQAITCSSGTHSNGSTMRSIVAMRVAIGQPLGHLEAERPLAPHSSSTASRKPWITLPRANGSLLGGGAVGIEAGRP